MTREQLHKNFKIEMDKNATNIAFGSYPAFLPEEIDYWLNQAMFQELSTKFTGRNFSQVPFEGTVKRIQDLERLVCTDTEVTAKLIIGTNIVEVDNLLNSITNSIPTTPDGDDGGEQEATVINESTITTKNRRMFFVNAVINWGADNTTTHKSIVRMVDHATANRFLETYNNKPWIDIPVATIEDNTLLIYIDTNSMKGTYSVDITYIKYPTLIEDLTDSNDDIPDYMWYEIINRSVLLALEDIESQRVQTKSQLNQSNE